MFKLRHFPMSVFETRVQSTAGTATIRTCAIASEHTPATNLRGGQSGDKAGPLKLTKQTQFCGLSNARNLLRCRRFAGRIQDGFKSQNLAFRGILGDMWLGVYGRKDTRGLTRSRAIGRYLRSRSGDERGTVSATVYSVRCLCRRGRNITCRLLRTRTPSINSPPG